ncbi:MAG TPA: AtpZ/AtpI family protein [Bryobacteraceae bacterium]|nr:AtpZ/AtpI family protein [Bryobacteraceae bacterium]
MAEKNIWVKAGEYSALAFLLPSTSFVGYVIGYLLDKWLGTTYLYLVFLVLGIAGGFVQLIRKANASIKEE